MSYDIDQLNRVEPAYLGDYGLNEAPFAPNHDSRFTYLSSDLSEQLDLLKHYTQYGNLLLIVTGERGIGKTTLIDYLGSSSPEEWQMCRIQAHTMMDSGLLLRQVANGFGISDPPLEPEALIEVLNSQLEHLHQQSYEPILLIDDAHELPQEALKSLIYLAEHHPQQQNILRIILFCEPEIETMLEDPAINSLKEKITHNIVLPVLNEEQTAEYLRHRLAVAGLDGTSPFTPKLVNKIFRASGGLPAAINEYAHQNLTNDREPIVNDDEDFEYDEQAPEKNLAMRNRVLGAIALIMVVVALIYQEDINKVFELPEAPVPFEVTETEQVSAQQDKTPFIQDESIPSKTEEKVFAESKQETTIEINLDKTASNNQEISTETQTEKETLPELKIFSVNPSPVPASSLRQIISITGKGFHERQSVTVRWTGNEKELSRNQVNVSSESFMNLTLSVGKNSDSWSVQITDPLLNQQSNNFEFQVVADSTPSAKPESKKAAIPSSTGSKENTWILQQDKSHYTIQILGTHQKDTINQFIKSNSLIDKAVVFRSVRNNRDWYTLIYGSYADKPTAQAAASKLPGSVKSPWIRSFDGIQESLKNVPAKKATSTAPVSSALKKPLATDNAESWLWSQDPRNYTLQLAAGTNKGAIESFITQYDLENKAVYFHRKRNGQDWYILLYGSFDGYSKAQKAISSLPSGVQKAKPWTRSFSAIHAELN